MTFFSLPSSKLAATSLDQAETSRGSISGCLCLFGMSNTELTYVSDDGQSRERRQRAQHRRQSSVHNLKSRETASVGESPHRNRKVKGRTHTSVVSSSKWHHQLRLNFLILSSSDSQPSPRHSASFRIPSILPRAPPAVTSSFNWKIQYLGVWEVLKVSND